MVKNGTRLTPRYYIYLRIISKAFEIFSSLKQIGLISILLSKNESEFWDFFSCLDSSSKELKYEKIL